MNRATSAVLLSSLGLAISVASAGLLNADQESTYLSEVRASNYEQLPPPDTPMTFRWDFSTAKSFSYSFRQVTDTKMNLGDLNSDEGGQVTSEGILEVKAQGDGTAKLVLHDVTVSMDVQAEGAREKPMSRKLPTMVVQGMREDGTFEAAQVQSDALFELILPLPPAAIEVGQEVVVPFSFPVNVMGSPLSAPASQTLRFTGLVYVRGHQCAQLDSRLTINDVEVPEELEATAHIGGSGEGRLFFDIGEHRLLEATIALQMTMTATFPGFDDELDQKEGAPSVPREMKMSSDSLIRLTSD